MDYLQRFNSKRNRFITQQEEEAVSRIIGAPEVKKIGEGYN